MTRGVLFTFSVACFAYLTMLGLGCTIPDLSLGCTDFLVVGQGLSRACGIPAARPGIKPTSSASEGGFLTTGPPGKFPLFFNYRYCSVAASLLTCQQVYKHTGKNAWRRRTELLAMITSRGGRGGFRDTRERRGATTSIYSVTLGCFNFYKEHTFVFYVCMHAKPFQKQSRSLCHRTLSEIDYLENYKLHSLCTVYVKETPRT